jgi:hypothetical protein
MAILSTLKAGVVALALAGTAITAIPAQAATPTFGFMLNLGGGGGIVLNFEDEDDFFDLCLTDKQVVAAIRAKGYSRVQIVDSAGGDRVWVIARKNGDWWQMRVDTCSGKVDRVKEIHPINDDDDDIKFNLTFTF